MGRTGQSTERDDYHALMDDIEMPNRVHDRVMREAHRLRRAEATRAQPTRRGGSRHQRRRFVGAVIATACALALVGGVAFAISRQLDGPPAENSFALDTHTTNFGHGGFWKVWHSDPEIDPNNADDAPDSGQRYLSVAYLFDLTCTGTNVASLTYTVEGDRVLFYTYARLADSTYREGDDPFVEDRASSFTVGYDEQNVNNAEIWRALRVSFPLEGETATLYDAATEEFYSGRRERDIELHENLNALLVRRYADIVSQARLEVTATFEDGSTETKTYVIAPVDNLEETVRAYGDALRAQAAEAEANPSDGTDPVGGVDQPQLFTFTQVE